MQDELMNALEWLQQDDSNVIGDHDSEWGDNKNCQSWVNRLTELGATSVLVASEDTPDYEHNRSGLVVTVSTKDIKVLVAVSAYLMDLHSDESGFTYIESDDEVRYSLAWGV